MRVRLSTTSWRCEVVGPCAFMSVVCPELHGGLLHACRLPPTKVRCCICVSAHGFRRHVPRNALAMCADARMLGILGSNVSEYGARGVCVCVIQFGQPNPSPCAERPPRPREPHLRPEPACVTPRNRPRPPKPHTSPPAERARDRRWTSCSARLMRVAGASARTSLSSAFSASIRACVCASRASTADLRCARRCVRRSVANSIDEKPEDKRPTG